MDLTELKKQRALNDLRDLRPIHPGVLAVLSVVARPWLWLGFFTVVLVLVGRTFSDHPHDRVWWALVPVALLVAAVQSLQRALRADPRVLPAETDTDPELRRAVDRLTRNGGRIRASQREVIDHYMRTTYGRP